MRPRHPSQESVFHGLRSLFQVFPLTEELAEDLTELGYEVANAPLGWPETIERPDHPANRFLQGASHDARLRSISTGEDRVDVIIEDYHAGRLAAALDETRSKSGGFFLPVTLSFRGVKDFVAYSDWPGGRLTLLRHGRRSALARATEFHSDKIVRWDDEGITAFLSLIGPRWRKGSRQKPADILLAIDAAELVIEEGQREVWGTRFGQDSLRLYDRFDADRARFYRAAMDAFYEFIRTERQG